MLLKLDIVFLCVPIIKYSTLTFILSCSSLKCAGTAKLLAKSAAGHLNLCLAISLLCELSFLSHLSQWLRCGQWSGPGKWAVNTRKPATAAVNEVALGWKLVRRGGTEVVAAAVTAPPGQTDRKAHVAGQANSLQPSLPHAANLLKDSHLTTSHLKAIFQQSQSSVHVMSQAKDRTI